ncbi:flagellar assembly protein FliH [Rhodoferax sp. TS-BS-61-7]|jgi:flagellar assembly protein FliH|uniref:FliH/SctL family protein n=1 Tax=Rhodoferax sp. TS-BS-61-7 TaxID=2094194 RepID=UPI000CF6E337|nr:flagellar assembly protein FliH [Rhodoferax sp. TS-BS-61-7]PQA77742.1 flagellar assembly protein FliH [Rhodoferax sp. TS-BS-61-7]
MSRNQARFISGEDVSTVTEWDFGAVDQSSVRFAAKLKAQAEAEEQAKEDGVRQAGYSEGYAAGYAQGHAQATLEGQRQINEYIATQGKDAAANFAALFESASAQLAESEQVMAQGVLELACELARQVLRHELSTNPNALQPVVREALGVLAVDSKAAVVRLHPLDLEVLAEVLRQEFSGLALTLLPDSSVARGGCLVESAGTVVDGTVEKRWQRALASLGFDSPWEPRDDHA